MSRKHKHQHPRPGAVAGGADSGVMAADHVRDLLALGKSRPALEAAKELHKQQGTAESETLLLDAYLARVRDLLALGLKAEAEALLDLARSRHPALALRQAELLDLQAAQGKLDEMLRPLADPAVTEEHRAAIEAVLRRRLLDPADLAQCGALPAEHPLRAGAAALSRALQAAASRPVTDEEIALPEIPRRSPLAPWKLLVRAIAAFHRGEDAACEQALAVLDPESAPGRLAPLMRAMMTTASAGHPPPRDPLARRISGRVEGLRQALAALDAALEAGRPHRILEAIRSAARACREERPDLEASLRQRVSIRAIMMDAPAAEIRDALGGASRKDAAFWRLFANAMEHMVGQGRTFTASAAWDRFLHHAQAEGWLAAGGPEEATLYRHMAGLFALYRGHNADLERERKRILPKFNMILDSYKDQPADVRGAAGIPASGKLDPYMLYPERLYERSCALDPRDETFREWLEWSRATDAPQLEAVALAWHRALPAQPAPLLELMAEAEKRGALKKALGWLEQAERLDALNPDVRRARWRILFYTAMNHLKQKKAHLAQKDLVQMESLELAREGDRPLLLAVLRWVKALLERDEAQLDASIAEAVLLLGEPHAAAAALAALASHVGLGREMQAATIKRVLPPFTPDYIESFLRVTAVLEECRMSLHLSGSQRNKLISLIQAGDYKADGPRMVRLARTAMKTKDTVLAYAATGVGLALGDGPQTAELLMLRGRSLPEELEIRSDGCILAAMVLARQRRDMELYGEALDEWRWHESQMFGGLGGDAGTHKEDLEMDPRHLERVLAFERARPAYPNRPDLAEEDEYLNDCPCARCEEFREGEREGWPGLDDEDDEAFNDEGPFGPEEDDEPAEDLFGPAPKSPKAKKSSLPSSVIDPLMDLMAKYMRPDGSLPPIEEVLDREPAIKKQLMQSILESGIGKPGGADDPEGFDDADPFYGPDDEFLPARQRTRSQRKRKTKKNKKK